MVQQEPGEGERTPDIIRLEEPALLRIAADYIEAYQV